MLDYSNNKNNNKSSTNQTTPEKDKYISIIQNYEIELELWDLTDLI